MAAVAALCLVAGALHVVIPEDHFTLRWQHSIEKIEWDEDYAVVGGWLMLNEARIRGSGAGMEPPPGAWFHDGVWHYKLRDPWRKEVVLARSPYVRDYEVCTQRGCASMGRWIPVSAGTTVLSACAVGR
ncbi:DUF1850 domain-containing protein [Variovorax sp. CAN2819]|uniref:DUF1850 domain-containing protein n=1 Tax=Variovorax sp. CAN15 TaxID=3046727 RepID=UPI0026474208|nr:DUF1850 domain-containing protein [Variovorax sp. CAN15]MDN6883514.1 DUF1850 domain-containing protein [Variovorax sp. CAN15]